MWGCLLVVPVLLIFFLLVGVGETMYGEVSPYTVALLTAALLAVIVYVLRNGEKRYAGEVAGILQKKAGIKVIAQKYNSVTDALAKQYRSEKSKKAAVRKTYQTKYLENKKNHDAEYRAFVSDWDSNHNSSRVKRLYQWGIVLGFILLMAGCGFAFGVSSPPEKESSQMAALADMRQWNADNIPMPHMTDGTQYVSNPDSFLTQTAVDSINSVLYQLDRTLGIESAFVIVGHIENDDPVSMVRGIYQKYKVGRNDRGLVVVVGYLDHSYFIAPGQSLEGDLTDLECNHLAQDYLIPSMKAERPDSGMLYLARGVYSLLQGKDMPRMSALTSADESDDDIGSMSALMLFGLMILAWGAYAAKKSDILGLTIGSTSFFHASPFLFTESSSGSFGSGRSYRSSGGGGSSWGGGHSSGGYGGGSWGGGGAGGRW